MSTIHFLWVAYASIKGNMTSLFDVKLKDEL